MIELNKKCKCGETTLTTHQDKNVPVSTDTVYGYCSECNNELSGQISECNVYHE